MLQKRIILTVSAIVLTVLLFMLPKVVVENDENRLVDGGSIEHSEDDSQQEESNFDHGVELTVDQVRQISQLRESLNNSEINKKSITFADSLVLLFRQGGKLDSTAKYLEWKALNFPNERNVINAGLGYYEAFGYAVNRNKLNYLGERTRFHLNKILENHPDRFDLKAKVAMTYVSSTNPMQGILMLREIVEIDSGNVEAIFNLGLLSRQSSQFEKAVERFGKLVSIDSTNIQARFLLGLSHLDLNQTNEAKKHFEIIKKTANDPAVLATVEGYLEDIN